MELLRKFILISVALITLYAIGGFSQSVPNDNPEGSTQQYGLMPGWETQVPLIEGDNGLSPESMQVMMPSPFTGGDYLSDSMLPTQPYQTIYRFQYLDVEADELDPTFPFIYLEVDWNTEGEPRGPEGAFITPHFDFHFYTRRQSTVVREMSCVPSGVFCDDLQTGYTQMRRFMWLPDICFIPKEYTPDVDSSIEAMGMHNVDSTFDFTIDNVNHSPILIYGTFNNELVFLEASLTLYAFQDAIRAAEEGNRLEWDVLQPDAYAYDWWPETTFLEYHSDEDRFSFGFTDFEQRDVQTSCN